MSAIPNPPSAGKASRKSVAPPAPLPPPPTLFRHPAPAARWTGTARATIIAEAAAWLAAEGVLPVAAVEAIMAGGERRCDPPPLAEEAQRAVELAERVVADLGNDPPRDAVRAIVAYFWGMIAWIALDDSEYSVQLGWGGARSSRIDRVRLCSVNLVQRDLGTARLGGGSRVCGDLGRWARTIHAAGKAGTVLTALREYARAGHPLEDDRNRDCETEPMRLMIAALDAPIWLPRSNANDTHARRSTLARCPDLYPDQGLWLREVDGRWLLSINTTALQLGPLKDHSEFGHLRASTKRLGGILARHRWLRPDNGEDHRDRTALPRATGKRWWTLIAPEGWTPIGLDDDRTDGTDGTDDVARSVPPNG